MIPKKIGFVWFGCKVPVWIDFLINIWKQKNPQYEVSVYDETVLIPEWKPIFDRSDSVCNKADVLKWSALKRYGGWMFDTDIVCLKSMDDFFHHTKISQDFVLVRHGSLRHDVDMGCIGATVDSPCWEAVDDFLSMRITHDWIKRPINVAGFWCANYVKTKKPEGLYILSEKVYCPYSRDNIVWRKKGIEFFNYTVKNDVRRSELLLSEYRRLCRPVDPFGWHLWTNGKDKLE